MKNKIIASVMLIFFVLFTLVNVSAIVGKLGNAKMILSVEVGDTIDRSVRVINDNNVSLNISISPSGDLENEINIIDNNFILNPNEEKNARFSVKLTEPGQYENRINVKFQPIGLNESGVGLSSQVIINVYKKGELNENLGEKGESFIENFEEKVNGGVKKYGFILGSTTILLAILLFILLYFPKKKSKNKTYSILIFIFGFLFLILIPISSAAEIADVAYIVKTINNVDNTITSLISEIGASYDIISENEISSTNFSKYNMILINDDIFTNPNTIPISDYNSLVINSRYYYRDNGDPQWGWSRETSSISSPSQLKKNTISSPILNGIPTTFNGYIANDPLTKTFILKGQKPTGIEIIVYESGSTSDAVVAILRKGGVFLNNKTAKGRHLFFGINGVSLWTSESRRLFKNSLDWVLRGEDRDNDGFLDSVDCNDNNINIHPGANEIAYDGIDQDCDGSDLNDVDEDNFIAQVVGGNDCNDNDPTINPNSTNLVKNCVNDPPTRISNIPAVSLQEDNNATINLALYFSDPENNALTFGVDSISDDTKIMIEISGSNAKIIPKANVFGNSTVIFNVSDGTNLVKSNSLSVTIASVNDNPILNFIQDVFVIVGSLIKIIPTASDADNDPLTFSFSSPLNSNGEWQTRAGNEGIRDTTVIVRDNKGGSDSQIVKLNVLSKIVINEFVADSDQEWIELYNTGSSNVALTGWTIEDNTGSTFGSGSGNTNLTGLIIPAKGFLVLEKGTKFNFALNNDGDVIILKVGSEEVDRVVYGNFDDGDTSNNAPIAERDQSVGRNPDAQDSENDASDFKIFENPTKGLAFNADVIPPSVTLLAPENNAVFNERNVLFEFKVEDNSQSVTCELFSNINGNFRSINSKIIQLSNGTAFSNFSIININDGNHPWNVKCRDSRNEKFSNVNMSFNINAPDAPIFNVIGNKIISENQTLEFKVEAIDQENDTISYAIENLPEGALFSNQIFKWTPNFNQSGSYNVKFIARDSGNLATEETITITVNNFKLPPEFNDAPKCTNSSNLIDLKIEDPNNGEDFEIGETIEVEIEIENKFTEEMDFDVEAHLYDINEDESLEDIDDELEVDDKDDETIDLKLKIPDDADEKNDFAIYVFVEDEDKNCASKFVEIKLEREEDVLKFSNIDLIPQVVRPGEEVIFSIDLENIGSDDQDDIQIEIISKDLGLNIKSESFEIEQFGDKDREKRELFFIIPRGAKKGEYEITINVLFNGETISEKRKLSVDPESFKPISEKKDIKEVSDLAYRRDKVDLNKIDITIPKKSERVEKEYPKTFEISKYDGYLQDERVRIALWILNAVLGIGIITFIVRLIVYIRR